MSTTLSTPSSPLRIGLLWHSLASGNLGVDALTVANMAIIRSILTELGLTADYTVIGMRDNHTSNGRPGEPKVLVLDFATLLSPSGLRRTVREFDCLIDIGAGDSFAEIYGAKRFAMLWLSKVIASNAKVPLILAPQTIGPFTKPIYVVLAAYVMRRARAVVTRDVPSYLAARSIASSANVSLSTDVAFALPYEDRSHLRGGAKKRVGVNVSGLLYHQALAGTNRFGLSYNYATFIDKLLTALLARGDCEVHLLPHATSRTDPGDDDGATGTRIAARFPGVIALEEFSGASEAKSYISGLDFLVAGRMHACIGAFSAGVPVVPTAYSRKFAGLFDQLEYPHVLPVTGVSVDESLSFILGRLDRINELAEAAERGMRKTHILLDVYRDALRSLFSEVAPTS